MRVAFDFRPAGYPLAVIMFLVAPYLLFEGSTWGAGALAVGGIIVLALLSRPRRGSTGLAQR